MPSPSREKIKQHLLDSDPRLQTVIENVAFPAFQRNRDVYAALVHSIVSQQLSVHAASTIHSRLLALFKDNYPHPQHLIKMPLTSLRRAGLSRQKAQYLKDIARFARDEGMSYESLHKLSDEQVIEQLTQIRGVGRWTVEMLLMFSLNRKDVFAVDDVGIQNAMRHLYRLRLQGRPFKQRLLKISEQWRPYRTIVCKYLWRWKGMQFTVTG